jgi:dipeptidyl aminopeptidase/acylaminoacyl peptidase
VVTAPTDKTARVWDAQTGKPVGEPMQHTDRVFRASFSPDSKRVVTVSEDKTARVWDAQTGKPVSEPMRHEGYVFRASFSPDGKRVVTASWDGTARIWDTETGKPVGEPMRHEDLVLVASASFSPDGKRVVTASWDGTARIWDAQTGKPVGEPMRHAGTVRSASFSPDGKWVVTASEDETARIWDAQTGKPVGEPLQHENFVRSASFSPDGKRVVTVSRETARIWDAVIVGKEAPQWLTGLAEAVGRLQLNAQGGLVATANSPVQFRQELRRLTGKDELSRFGRWYAADPSTRPISPLSSITVSEFVEQRLREDTAASVEEAYDIDPGNPVVLASLARFTLDTDEALFYCRLALQRARTGGSREHIERVQAVAKSLFPDLAEFSGVVNPPSTKP